MCLAIISLQIYFSVNTGFSSSIKHAPFLFSIYPLGAYAHASRASQLTQQAMPRRDFVGPSRERERERDREQRERDRAQRERERERDREHRERERERERERRERERQREREKSPVRKRSRSPRRSKSPRRSPRRTKRLVQRYVVQIPRFALDMLVTNVLFILHHPIDSTQHIEGY